MPEKYKCYNVKDLITFWLSKQEKFLSFMVRARCFCPNDGKDVNMLLCSFALIPWSLSL
jgi:hypothetical protein